MSKFSDYLKQLIDDSNESVSSISRGSGVERTSIHKAISGERLLAYSSIKKIADYLRLSPEETDALNDYHDMQIQGEKTYEVREAVLDLLKTLTELPEASKSQQRQELPHLSEDSSVTPAGLLPQMLISGVFNLKTAVKLLIDREMENEDPLIRMYLPTGEFFILNYLFTVFQQYETQLQIRHIIPYSSNIGQGNTSDSVTGLTILKNALSLTLTNGQSYFPSFFYSRQEPSVTLFPYYLMNSRAMIMISADMTTGLYLDDPNVLRHGQEKFDQLYRNCKPLLKYQDNPMDILTAYENGTVKSSYMTFMPQACCGRYYTDELIAAKLRHELPIYTLLLEKSIHRFSMLRTAAKYYTFFTEKGMRNFAANGIICDIPQSLITPLTVSERRDILVMLRNDIDQDIVNGRFFREEKIRIPERLSFCVTENRTVEIFSLVSAAGENGKELYFNIHIEEPLIGEAFYDFIMYLPKSQLLASKEETLRLLDELVASL